jgi:lysozyme
MNEQMQTSKEGLNFIAKWEGCILKPYRDIAGLRTIGIGHLIKPGENFPDGVEISREKALEILSDDVKKCEDAIKKYIKVALNQNQFDALVSFGFNCGTGVYLTSDACKSLNTGDYDSVPEKLLSWSKAKINGVLQTNQGLYNRRMSEGQLFSGNTTTQETVKWTKENLSAAQEILKKMGLYNIKVDGIWGPTTFIALSNFSAKIGMSMGDNPKVGIPKKLYEVLFGEDA